MTLIEIDILTISAYEYSTASPRLFQLMANSQAEINLKDVFILNNLGLACQRYKIWFPIKILMK